VAELYEKGNPFVSTVVEPSVDASEKDPKSVDVEATLKIVADVASSEIEKGNPYETPNSAVSKSGRKLGLEDLNAPIDSTENMNVDNPNLEFFLCSRCMACALGAWQCFPGRVSPIFRRFRSSSSNNMPRNLETKFHPYCKV